MARRVNTRSKDWFVVTPKGPRGRRYFATRAAARTAARSLSRRYGMASVHDDAVRVAPEFFADGSIASYSVPLRSGERFKKLRRSRRDVSRADLKHLSVAALMKLLRQAVRSGDEDKAEMIGKELDRRSRY